MTLAVLTAGMAWAATWLRPPKPACLVLIGAGYEDNLAIPHNHFGWEGLNHLAKLAHDSSSLSFWGEKLLDLKQEPVRLRSDTRWDQNLEQLEQKTLVLVMAAHGGADTQGAYLLPHDAGIDPTPANRLDLKEILTRLAQLPAEKHKLLILDVTGLRVAWTLGMLENAFVKELRNLEPQIAAIPNCVVLCASDLDQRSWTSEDFGQTIYLHFLGEGLRGGADDNNLDGRVNVWELHQYTKTQVSRWVARNRVAVQSPILLPSGKLGEERAGLIDLCVHRAHYEPGLPIDRVFPVAEIRDLWQSYRTVAESNPAPTAYSPQLWRRYQLATLRCEQMLCAGDFTDAARLRNLLRDLAIEIDRNCALKLCSQPNTLAMPNACGQTLTLEQASRDVFQQLWSADPQKYVSLWQAAQAQAAQPQLLQLGVSQQLVLRAAEDPANNLTLACNLFEVVHDPLHCGPAETHLMLMLQKDLPAWARQPEANEVISAALQLRLLAEQVAATASAQEYAYTEEIHPWIADQIQQADSQRRLGEDLLFADATQQPLALNYFRQAREGYEAALRAADRVRSALLLRNEVFAQLPYYSQWLAHHASDNLIRPGDEAFITSLQNLWQDAHALAHQLGNPNPGWIAASPPANPLLPSPRSLIDQTNAVRQGYRALEQSLTQRWDELTRIELADVCSDSEAALRVPFDDIDLRIKMLTHMDQVSRRFALDQSSQSPPNILDTTSLASSTSPANQAAAPDKTSPVAKANSVVDSQLHSNSEAALAEVNDVAITNTEPVQAGAASTAQQAGEEQIGSVRPLHSIELLRERTQVSARWQGRAALAVLGREWFDSCPGQQLETFEQVQHRLDIFNVEENWRLSLLSAGAQIRARWTAIPDAIHQLVENSQRQADDKALDSLQQAAELARLLDAGGTLSIRDDPTGAHRRILLQRYLLSAAERTWIDHWYAVDPAAEPYYITAGLVFLNDAARLFPNSGLVKPLRQKITTPTQLAVQSPTAMQITSEPRFQVRYELTMPDLPPGNLGFPVCWFETDQELSLVQPQPGQRVYQQPAADRKPAAVTAVVDNPQLVAAETKMDAVSELPPSTLTLRALYRGQEITAATRVQLAPWPEIMQVQIPITAPANLAVRADAELHGEFGAGSGAIAIVLDCSGSMGPKEGDAFTPQTKFAEATAALERVLQHLPPGTKVSLWVFGQAIGTAKTTPQPEDTIRQIQPPVTWDSTNPIQLQQLMSKVSYPALEPWNESPILRTMLAAKNDLSGVSGFKTMLVITDGMDNRFSTDTQSNPSKQDIPTALVSAFQDSGITVNIVGFKVVGGEQAEAKRQFKAVERLFPPGHFYPVDQAVALASTLDSALDQRLRYWIEDFQNRRLPAVPADGLDVGQAGGGDHWLPKGLAGGNYQLSAMGEEPVRQPVALDPGDMLLTTISQHSGKISFERLVYSQSDYPWKPWRLSGDWRLAVLQNQRLPENAVQMLVTLEQQPAAGETFLQLSKPRDLWLEVAPRGEQACRMTRWGYSADYPAPAWSIDIAGWPREMQQESPLRPQVNVWWSPDQPAAPTLSLMRQRDFQVLEDLIGHTVQALTKEITIDDISLETHVVEVKPGVREARPCLAIRLELPPAQRFWVRPLGLEIAGVEHRYYPGSRKYTGLFWPVTTQEAATVLTGISLISLEEFKAEATRRGYASVMDSLPAPNPDDSRPRSPFVAQ